MQNITHLHGKCKRWGFMTSTRHEWNHSQSTAWQCVTEEKTPKFKLNKEKQMLPLWGFWQRPWKLQLFRANAHFHCHGAGRWKAQRKWRSEKYYDEKSFKLSEADGKGPPLKPLYILEDKFKKEANFQIKKIKPSWKEWFLFFFPSPLFKFFLSSSWAVPTCPITDHLGICGGEFFMYNVFLRVPWCPGKGVDGLRV